MNGRQSGRTRRRRSSFQVAAATAFRLPARSATTGSPAVFPIRTRIKGSWLAFVVGFPGVIGVTALLVSMGRSIPNDGAVPFGIGCVAIATTLLILGAISSLALDREGLSVRFFGLRRTTVRFDELVAATFVMSWPSISFALVLRDRGGRSVRFHANWWRDEVPVLEWLCRGLIDLDVPMDRSTARIVASVLRVKRPKAKIVHHGLLRKDRTW